MNPGDVLTCSTCGARSLPLHTTGGRRFEDGGALVVSWDHGPNPRHEAASVLPTLCLWCDDKRLGFPPPSPARDAGDGRSSAAAARPVPPAGEHRDPEPRLERPAPRGQLSLL
jgi:hypothetical protein